MRIGGNTRADRYLGEVTYYLHSNMTPAWMNEFEPRTFDFDLPYAWPVTLYAADGGWLISAIDYARFVAAIDGLPSYPDILSTNSVAAMLAAGKPSPFASDGFFGMGWDVVRPNIGTWYKSGADTGNCDLAYKYRNNVIAVFSLNSYWGGGSTGLVWDPLATELSEAPACVRGRLRGRSFRRSPILGAHERRGIRAGVERGRNCELANPRSTVRNPAGPFLPIKGLAERTMSGILGYFLAPILLLPVAKTNKAIGEQRRGQPPQNARFREEYAHL